MKMINKFSLTNNDKKCYSNSIFYEKISLHNHNKEHKINKRCIKKPIKIHFCFFIINFIRDKLKDLIVYKNSKIKNFSNSIDELLKPFLYIKLSIPTKELRNKIAAISLKKFKQKKEIIIIKQKNIKNFFFKKFISNIIYFSKKKVNYCFLLNNVKLINRKKLFEKRRQNVLNTGSISYSYSYFDFFSNDLVKDFKNLHLESSLEKKKNSLYFFINIFINKIYNLFFLNRKKQLYYIDNEACYAFKKYFFKISKKQKFPVLTISLFLLLFNNNNRIKMHTSILKLSSSNFKIEPIQNNKKRERLKKNQYYFYYVLKKNLYEIKLNIFNSSYLHSKIISLFRYLILKKFLKIKTSKKIFKKFMQELVIFNYYRI